MPKKKTRASTKRAVREKEPGQSLAAGSLHQSRVDFLGPRQPDAGRSSLRHRSLLFAGLFVLSLILVAALVFEKQLAPAGSPSTASFPHEISVEDASEKYQVGAFFLDVREPEEWQEYHIPGATLIPLGSLSSRLSELPRDQEIVVVCRSGSRSAAGRDILLQSGFTNVTSMAGGMLDWRSAGYESVSGN